MTLKSIIFFLCLLLPGTVYSQGKDPGEIYTSQFVDRLIKKDLDWFQSYQLNRPSYFSQAKGKDFTSLKHALVSYKSDHSLLTASGIDSSDVDSVQFIYTRERMIQEHLLHLNDSVPPLPLAVVADVWDGEIDFTRLYFDYKKLDSIPASQNPIFAYNSSLRAILPGVIKSFLFALEKPDVSIIEELISDTTYYQTFDGSRIENNQLFNFLDSALTEGGMKLQLTRITFDGGQCALEWNMKSWGKKKYNGSPGLMVFDLKDDLIHAIRNYGAIETPIDVMQFTIYEDEAEEAVLTPIAEIKSLEKWEMALIAVASLLMLFFIYRKFSNKEKYQSEF